MKDDSLMSDGPHLTVGLVEAMFGYLDKLEDEVTRHGWNTPAARRGLGLPGYAFGTPRVARGTFPSCGAPVRFVFVSSGRSRATAPVGGTGGRPTGTINDPETCRQRGLCFPHLLRQELAFGDFTGIMTRNPNPYGLHHAVVRSAEHEPQAECFRQADKLRVAFEVAKALGSETESSEYEAWVAGDGFNTQWHLHIQFRKQRSPIWEYLGANGKLADYPSKPAYFQGGDDSTLVHTVLSKILTAMALPKPPSMGVLLSYDRSLWTVLLVQSWRQPEERLFGTQLGLHEHLGEIILESEEEFNAVETDVGVAVKKLETALQSAAEQGDATGRPSAGR